MVPLLVIITAVTVLCCFTGYLAVKQIRGFGGGVLSKGDALWVRSGRTRRVYGRSGTKIGEITQSIVTAPYTIFSTADDVEITSACLAAEVYANKPEKWLRKMARLEGLLKASALVPNAPRVEPVPCLITLLIDHSGSLRGEAVEHLVAAVHHAAQILEAAGLAFEILGFTTQSWKGGNSRRLWVNTGKPKRPGRLCDLLYIEYKTMNEPYEAALPHMALMLEDDIRRENLDGEALLWAHTRFEKSGFKHWTCIVLSDGAPVDDSTLSENGKTYLADHLKWVISELDRKPNVQIVAVGIGRSVDADYPECKYVKDSTSLSKVLQVLLSEIVTGCQSISSTIPSDAPSEK